MKIAILSQEPSLYSTRRLREAGEARGCQMRVVNYLRCYLNVSAGRPAVIYQGRPLEAFDAIIPRIAASRTFYGTAVVRQFELMGVFSANPSQGISHSRDKLHCLQILAREGIGFPITGSAYASEDIGDLLETIGGAPVAIKVLEGTQGIGVVLADTLPAARSAFEAFRGLQANVLVQEFVREAAGEDIRCFVVGGKVVAAIKRRSPPGDFRSNIHRGGRAQPVKLTPEERRLAVRAAKAVGLNLAGVDLLRSHRGPLAIEVNSSPGLEAIEKATGTDVAAQAIEFVVRGALSVKPCCGS